MGRIILIQYNQGGCPDTIVANVHVIESPEAYFDADDEICGLSEITYSTELQDNEICKWEVTNGMIIGDDTQSSVQVRWNESGNGVLKLTVTDERTECTDIYEKTITLLNNPAAKILGGKTGCLGREGIFTFRKSDNDSLAMWYVNGSLQEEAKDTLFFTFDKIGTNTVSLKRITKQGCSDSGFVDIEIFETPEPPVITQSGDSIISNVDEGNIWFFNDEEISGEYENFIIPLKSGKYSAKVENRNNCRSDMSNYIDYIVGDVREIAETNLFVVYPTVTKGTLNVEIKKNISNSINIALINMLGKQVLSKELKAASQGMVVSLDLSDLPQGGYLIRIETGNEFYFGKIIIIK
jgi:hypothetical protein